LKKSEELTVNCRGKESVCRRIKDCVALLIIKLILPEKRWFLFDQFYFIDA
jgi:hypothetical protein